MCLLPCLRHGIEDRPDGRIAHPTDGRSYRLELTPRGERVTRAADPVLAECYAVVERLLPRPLAEYQSAVQELNVALEHALAELEERESASERRSEEHPLEHRLPG